MENNNGTNIGKIPPLMSVLMLVPPVVDQRPPATQIQPLMLQKVSPSICTVPIVDPILQEPGVSPSSSSNIDTVTRPQLLPPLNKDEENKAPLSKKKKRRRPNKRIRQKQNLALGRGAQYSLGNGYGAPYAFAKGYIHPGVIEMNKMNVSPVTITRVTADDVIEPNEANMSPVTTTHVEADDLTEQNEINMAPLTPTRVEGDDVTDQSEINMVPIIITISLPECSLLDDEFIF